MQDKFEGMVGLIHNYQIEGAQAYIDRKESELADTKNRLEALRRDDSEARKLAQDILDLASKLKLPADAA